MQIQKEMLYKVNIPHKIRADHAHACNINMGYCFKKLIKLKC